MRGALIIANTEYTDPGPVQLTAPGKDAEDFARVLKDPNICAFDEVNECHILIRLSARLRFLRKLPGHYFSRGFLISFAQIFLPVSCGVFLLEN